MKRGEQVQPVDEIAIEAAEVREIQWPRPEIQRWLVCGGYQSVPWGYIWMDAAWKLVPLLERADP